MDNYYETCLEQIKELIEAQQIDAAMEKLNVELSMPYVPQPYFDLFKSLKEEIRPVSSVGSRYFDTFEEIEDGLHGNEELKHKALISLERMNLRSETDGLRRLMKRDTLDDWLKKQILFFMMSQDIDVQMEVLINNTIQTIDTKSLTNPIGSEAYLSCLTKLRDMLESHNPSLLVLCNDELDIRVLEYFPNHYESIDPEDILKTVESYLNSNI